MSTKPKANISSALRTQMGSLNIAGKIYPLFEGVNTIGRNKDATVTIRDPNVSQQHALIIIIDENRRFLSDLGSSNGTVVEHNKLNPMLLYELPRETIILFAQCKAIYKQVSSNSQSISNQSCSDTQSTQNLNESIYTAQTQALDNVPTKRDVFTLVQHPTCDYFEDDYNFVDIPSPISLSNQESTTDVTSAAGLSIHEMPTQIYCSDVVHNEIVGNSQVPESCSSNSDCNVGHQIVTTKADVHELPTQIICYEVGVHESASIPRSKALLQSSSIHDAPTQIIDYSKETSSIHDKPTQPVNKNTNSKSICDETLDDILICGNESIKEAERKSIINASLDVIEATHLDDSGLDTTAQSLQSNKSGRDLMPAILEDIKAASSPSSLSPLHVSQIHRRTLKPVGDDSEDDIISSGSEIVKNQLHKKSIPLLESDNESTDSNSEEIGKQKKKICILNSDNSETDIEDLQDIIEPKVSKLPNESSLVNENQIFKSNSKETHDKMEDKNNTSRKNTSDSDTDIEDFKIQEEASATSRKKNKGIKKKKDQNLNNLTKLNETDVISNIQVSEDDSADDDFNFMPENNSTLINRESSEQPKERIFDVSQKLKELRRASVLPQNLSEESFHLGLSEGSENAKYVEEQVTDNKNEEDDDKTPDISDIDEPVTESDVGKKLNENNVQDIFEMATQKLADDVVIQNENSDSVFAKPTTNKYFGNIKKQSESQKSFAKYRPDPEEDLFMQPTQPITSDHIQVQEDLCPLKHKSTLSTVTNNDDIFMQPTQKYTVDNQDDIFMQPTQQVVSSDALVNKSLSLDYCKSRVVSDKNQPVDDIFIQPTQLIDLCQSKTINNKPDNDIFRQPTQEVVSDDGYTIKPPLTHHKPERLIKKQLEEASATLTKHLSNENIFQQSTQRVEVLEFKTDNTKLDENDLFMQATQHIIPSTVSSNECPISDQISDKDMLPPQKSLTLDTHSKKRNKLDEVGSVESQLEVLFASQTLRISSQTDSRPLNPLANVLNQQQTADCEQNSEESEVKKKSNASDNEDEDVKLPDSHNSFDSSDDLKEYCVRPTLPIAELTDFQVHDDSKSRKRPPKSKTPEVTNISSDTPRKRGRPCKTNIKDRTSELTNISHNTRKSMRTRKSSSDEKVATKTVNKNLLEKEPCPGTSATKNKIVAICQDDEDSKTGNRKHQDRGDDITDENDEIEAYKNYSKKNIESNSGRKLLPSRITRKTNADEGNAKHSKVINEKKIKPDDDEDSDNTDPNSKEITSKTLNKSKYIKKTNISEIIEETDKHETKPENIRTRTSTRININKQNKPFSTSNEIALERRTLRSKKVEDTIEVIISSDNSDSNVEDGNIATTSGMKHRKVNKKMQNIDSVILQEETGSLSSNKRQLDISNTISEKRRKQSPTSKYVQNNKKATETSDQEHSSDLNPTTLGVSEGKKSKRLLSKHSEKDIVKPPPKKMKNTESSENEEVKSNSDSSEMNFRTPRKSNINLNVTSNTPDRTRRVPKPKVVFTMLNSPELESLVRTLGGMVVDTVSACTVLVTGTLKRSQKLLSAVGEGKPICSPKWLNESKKMNKFLDPWDYILEDKEAQTKWNFTLKESLNRSQNTKLLQEFTVVLAVIEAVDVLRAAIESCGGKCVMKSPPKNVENNLVIVANPNKKATYSKFLKLSPAAIVVAPEAIFDGVLRQELHWEDHRLS